MAKKKKRAARPVAGENPAPASGDAGESQEARRARQVREWESRKKQKERSAASGSPLPWVAGGVGLLAAVVVGAVLLLSGGGSDGTSATPVVDPRVTGLPVDQTVELIAEDDGQSVNPRFEPNVVNGKAGEVIEFQVRNEGTVAHNLTVSGPDKEYGTPDDFTMNSIDAGEESTLRVKLNTPGTYPFRCDLHPEQQIGSLILS